MTSYSTKYTLCTGGVELTFDYEEHARALEIKCFSPDRKATLNLKHTIGNVFKENPPVQNLFVHIVQTLFLHTVQK